MTETAKSISPRIPSNPQPASSAGDVARADGASSAHLPRRQMLKGGLGMLVATIATPVSATAAPVEARMAALPAIAADATLIAMRPALLEAHLKWDAALSRYGAAQEAFWKEHGKRPGWQPSEVWNSGDGHPDGWAARDAYDAAEEAAPGPSKQEADELADFCEDMVSDLLSKRARTIEGMRLKVEVAYGLYDDLETSLAEDLIALGRPLTPWGRRCPKK